MQTIFEYPDGKRGPARQWVNDGNVYPCSFLVRDDGEADADFAARLAPLGVTPVRVELPEVDQATHELGEAVETVEAGWIVVRHPNPAPKRAAWDTSTRERVLLCSDEPTPEGFTELAPPEDSPFVSWDGGAWVLDEAAQLSDAVERKRREIVEGSDALMSKLTATYSEHEKLTWPKQEAEAKALQADPNAAAPLLRGLAEKRGLTAETMASKVLANVAAYETLSASVIGQQQVYEDQLKAATTYEEVEAIAVEYAV